MRDVQRWDSYESTPSPEGPLRVGDWVRLDANESGKMAQITEFFDGLAVTDWPHGDAIWNTSRLTRIQPPVGWPVGVPTEDSGTRWYVADDTGDYWALDRTMRPLTWADLLAVGGVPALAVTR